MPVNPTPALYAEMALPFGSLSAAISWWARYSVVSQFDLLARNEEIPSTSVTGENVTGGGTALQWRLRFFLNPISGTLKNPPRCAVTFMMGFRYDGPVVEYGHCTKIEPPK